jgi:hypothetical protein
LQVHPVAIPILEMRIQRLRKLSNLTKVAFRSSGSGREETSLGSHLSLQPHLLTSIQYNTSLL